jgi:glycosyltransferase involved in cell wall biosynthesis
MHGAGIGNGRIRGRHVVVKSGRRTVERIELRPLKIAQLAPYYDPSIGGVETVVQYVSEELVRRGHDVHVLTSNRGHRGFQWGAEARSARINGVAVHRHFSLLNIGHMSLRPGCFGALWKGGFDVIHSHVYRHPHNEMASQVSRFKYTPLVLHGHGPFFANVASHPIKKRLYATYDFYARRFFFKTVGFVIALTEFERQKYLRLGVVPERIAVIGNAAGDECFEANSDGGGFIAKYKLQGRRILLFVGNLNAAKRPDLLIKALPSLRNRIPNVQVVMIGADEGMGHLLEVLAARLGVGRSFLWAGPQRGNDKIQALRAAELLVMPSDSDVFPLAVVEAMATGLPVVCSDALAQSGIIEPGATGLIFRRGDASDLVNKTLSLMEAPQQRQRMGRNARASALRRFRVSVAVDRIEEIYYRMIEEHPCRRPSAV